MHECSCRLTFESEQAYAVHKVFCKYGLIWVAAVFLFLLFIGGGASYADPCPGAPDDCEMVQIHQVYLPVAYGGNHE